MFFKGLEDRLSSLDIETSGLSEKEDWIWSIGTSKKGSEKERFIKPPSSDRAKDLFDNQIFNIKGYFDPYKDAISSGKTMSQKKAIQKMFGDIDKESVLLIQNINFENKFIGESLSTDKANKYAEKFAHVSDVHNGRLLYTPPEVTQARHQAARQSTLLQYAKTDDEKKTLLKNINSTYEGMLSHYQKSIDKKSGAVTVELMDISRATYAAAAQKGFISPEHIRTGLSVDFLSKVFFGKAEKHTAAADAALQIKIFDRLNSIREELEVGNLSDKTKSQLAKIKATQPFESSRTFFSSMRNTLEEIQRESTRIIDPLQVTYRNISVDGKEYKLSATMSGHTQSTDEALAHVVERYSRTTTAGVDPEAVAKSLSGKSIDDQIDILRKAENGFKDRIDRKFFGQETFIDKAKEGYDGISKKARRTVGLGIAAAAVYAMTSSEEDKSTPSYEERELLAARTRSSNKTFKMFSEPEVYHGTGLYLWENAVRHHEY